MIFRNVQYYFSEAFSNMTRSAFVSIATIMTIAISLIILGGFFLLLVNITSLTNNIASNFEIVAYLRKDLSQAQIAILKTKLLYIDEVEDVKFISKEEALLKMKKNLSSKINIEDILPENPLPDSMTIKVTKPEYIGKVARQVEKFKEIEKIKYGQEFLSKLMKLSRDLRVAGIIVGIFLGIGTMLLVTNTIKLAIFSKRKEIRIMQLVGATDWFIRWPYLLEGIIHGAFGAMISIFVLVFSYLYLISYIQKSLPFIPVLTDVMMLVNLSCVIFASGILLGLLGSMMAVGKFLVE